MSKLAIEVDAPAQPTNPLSSRSLSVPVPGAPHSAPQRSRPSRPVREAALDLPPPDSDQWQVMEMPPPPTHRTGKQRKK